MQKKQENRKGLRWKMRKKQKKYQKKGKNEGKIGKKGYQVRTFPADAHQSGIELL